MTVDVPRRLAAESIGTAMLLAAVVGSGIMADRLSGGNDAIALLANTVATAAALAALILTFGPSRAPISILRSPSPTPHRAAFGGRTFLRTSLRKCLERYLAYGPRT